MLHYTLTKRLGAEVDYIVKGIDGEAGIAVASRLEAMQPAAVPIISVRTEMGTICCMRAYARKPVLCR